MRPSPGSEALENPPESASSNDRFKGQLEPCG
jgi:hypothetical protein